MQFSHRSTFLSKIVLVVFTLVFALLLTPVISQAQNADGKFTLPFEVHWGNAVLSPGKYVFTVIPSKTFYFLYVRSKTASTFILPEEINRGMVSEHSQLNIVNIGQEHFVQSFEFKEMGNTFLFQLPSPKADVSMSSATRVSHLRISNRPVSN